MSHSLLPQNNWLSTVQIQGAMQNKSTKYVLFVCPNPPNGNLTQVGSRSFRGSWELLGIFKSLFVFTLENQALASAPLNPPLKTQRQRWGMWNVSGQTAPSPSERERDGGTRPDLCVFSYIAKKGQKWNRTHAADGVHLHTLQKIITEQTHSNANRMCENTVSSMSKQIRQI